MSININYNMSGVYSSKTLSLPITANSENNDVHKAVAIP